MSVKSEERCQVFECERKAVWRISFVSMPDVAVRLCSVHASEFVLKGCER